MKLINQKKNGLITLYLLLATLWISVGQTPGRHWEQYVNVSDAGFSSEKLALVSEQFKNSQGAALMVVRNGKVVLAQGDITRRFMAHSIRKAFMNALYGIYHKKGIIDLDATLQTLDIDDINKLTIEEKKATITDLLSSRSGVYLPSAYSPRGMEKNLPERGSYEPGTNWYYNNWDFNVLLTIFEQQTGKLFSQEFDKRIAKKIGMEDFRLVDIFYRYEKERSTHPAYLFKMSARDMARFGVLYLNEGRWKGKNIVPAQWVHKSTSVISTDLGKFSDRGGFGYLWWVTDGIKGEPMYYTSGSGGQRIMILPNSDMVIVHRTNTYEGNNVSDSQVLQLVEKIIDAKTNEVQSGAVTIQLNPENYMPETLAMNKLSIKKYTGIYKHPFLGYFTVRSEKKKLYLDTNIGVFRMFATDTDTFFPEDLETPTQFVPAPDNALRHTIKPVFGQDKSLQKAIMYY